MFSVAILYVYNMFGGMATPEPVDYNYCGVLSLVLLRVLSLVVAVFLSVFNFLVRLGLRFGGADGAPSTV
jgi:hypothetical protein